MQLSFELIGLIFSLIIQLIAVGIFIGVFKTTVAFMQIQLEKLEQTLIADKKELKEDMRKYNNVLERMIINEQSVKVAHHRIDDIIGNK